MFMSISIPWLSKRRAKPGRVGLTVGPDGLALAHLDGSGSLVHCQFYPVAEGGAKQLQAIVDQHNLADIPCTVVLHPAFYQLLLAETPQVKGDEMSAAVRWRVKELLNYPLDQAAIDYFTLAEDAYRGRQKMFYAAALPKQELQNLVTPVEASGLLLDCVEITELAMHQLSARLPSDAGGVALVQLYDGGGLINLVEDGAIYLSRRLDVGLEAFSPTGNNQIFFDTLFLEIQRSLDFYESQLGKGIITQLHYSPGLPETAEIGKFLSEQLALNVSALDLSPLKLVATLDEELDEQMSRCASAIGAALGPIDDVQAVLEVASAAS